MRRRLRWSITAAGPGAPARPGSATSRALAGRTYAGLALASLSIAALAGCGSSVDPVAGVGLGADTTGSVQIEVVTTTTPGQTSLGEAVRGEAAPPTTAGGANPDGSASGVTHTLIATAVVPEVVARAEPDGGSAVVAELASPIASGTRLVMRVLDGGAQIAGWVHVQLPVEPNGTTGWVEATDVEFATSPYRVEIDRASYSLKVFNLDELWVDTTIAVGTGDTPTPVGQFYLLELLAPENPNGPYGPYAFGLSGFSEVLDGFAGADTAIIGIHGTNDPSALGGNVSHGCIRVSNEVIEELASTLPLGTPVIIT